jgi:hypothetical protein
MVHVHKLIQMFSMKDPCKSPFPKSSIVMSYCWATHVYQNSHSNIKFEGKVTHCSKGFDWLVHKQKIDKEISRNSSQQIFNIHDVHYA